jgi:hypothetical protein
MMIDPLRGVYGAHEFDPVSARGLLASRDLGALDKNERGVHLFRGARPTTLYGYPKRVRCWTLHQLIRPLRASRHYHRLRPPLAVRHPRHP